MNGAFILRRLSFSCLKKIGRSVLKIEFAPFILNSWITKISHIGSFILNLLNIKKMSYEMISKENYLKEMS